MIFFTLFIGQGVLTIYITNIIWTDEACNILYKKPALVYAISGHVVSRLFTSSKVNEYRL